MSTVTISKQLARVGANSSGKLDAKALDALSAIHTISVNADMLSGNRFGLTFSSDTSTFVFKTKADFANYVKVWDSIVKSANFNGKVLEFKRGFVGSRVITNILKKYCDSVEVNIPMTPVKPDAKHPILTVQYKGTKTALQFNSWKDVITYSNILKKVMNTYSAMTNS